MKMPRVSTWPSLAEEVSSTTTGIGPNFTPFAVCENTMLQGAIKGVTGNGQGFLGECGRSAEGQKTCPPVEPGLILSHQSLIRTQLRMYAFSLDPEKKNYNRTETPKTNLMCILVSLSTHRIQLLGPTASTLAYQPDVLRILGMLIFRYSWLTIGKS